MIRFLNKVFCGDSLRLLAALPTASVDAVISDPMYGASTVYDWGPDPARGDPVKHWLYHQPIYRECLRVLKPAGVLAWAQSVCFKEHFDLWFGEPRKWTLYRHVGRRVSAHLWVVQTGERQPVNMNRDGVIGCAPMGSLKLLHPCVKPVEELLFMVEALTSPGQIVLDPFCGLGSTLMAAEELSRSWLGCDLSRHYCQVAMKRLDHLRRLGPERARPSADKPWFVPGGSPAGQSYRTPPGLFELLHGIFRFTVDAAASDANALLPRYWTERHDALRQDWSQETVFCNPPFNNIGPFLAKARTARKALVLVPLNFLTSRSFGPGADFIIIPKGRVNYFTGKERKVQPILGTCFLLYGELDPTEAAAVTGQGWQYFLNHEAVA